MRVWRQRILSTICAITITASTTPGTAQTVDYNALTAEQKQKLGELVEGAKRDYDVGSFEASLEGFQRAYDIYPHPDILYRMGLCYERLGEDASAVRHYKQFLELVPDAPERPRIEKTIEVIEARISRSEIRVSTDPEGAMVYFDDRANGVSGYTPTELPVNPGNYRVIVHKEGFETVEELVSVEPGQTLQLRYQLAPENPKVNAPTASSSADDRIPKVVALVAVGVASGIASSVFFGGYGTASTELETLDRKKAIDKDSVTREEYDDAKSSMYTNLALGVTTAGISVGALVWAYILWSDVPGETAMTPSAGWQDGPNVGVTWTW